MTALTDELSTLIQTNFTNTFPPARPAFEESTMHWNLVLERRTVNRLNVETTSKKLRRIASAAERNKGLGFVGRVGKVGDPVLMTDEETNEEVWRYQVRLRLEKTNV